MHGARAMIPAPGGQQHTCTGTVPRSALLARLRTIPGIDVVMSEQVTPSHVAGVVVRPEVAPEWGESGTGGGGLGL